MRHHYGIHINNPGLLPHNDMWQGLDDTNNKSKRYSHFVDPVSGIRALAITLVNFYDKAKKDKSDTIKEIMLDFCAYRKLGPNTTAKQVQLICDLLHTDGNKFVNLHDYSQIKPLISSIIIMYNGIGEKKSDNTWFDEELLDEGLRRAGIVKQDSDGGIIPLTKESVGAGGVAVVGVAQMVDVLPDLIPALDKAKADLSSGDWVEIVFGAVTLAVSFYIIWAQIKKRKNGVV